MKKKSSSKSLHTWKHRAVRNARQNSGRPSSSEGRLTAQASHCPPLLEQRFLVPLLPLVGREEERKTLYTLLSQPEVRLLTLTGPGGVGKTRLTLQLIAEVRSIFPDGICFVSLVPITTADQVLPTIVQALGLTEHADSHSLAQIADVLQDKRFLLLLDNFEQVAAAALHLKELLAACPLLKIVVTSRIILGLLEEHVFSVAPLALPDLSHLLPRKKLPDSLSQVAAVSLFLQRVRAIRPDFTLTDQNAYAVAQICVSLDGLPLALELAAARMTLFSPHSLLTRLESRLSVLTSGPRDAPERQQTLRKTIEWSYDLLTPKEQQLFYRLAVFVQGCSLQAIEAINSDMIDNPDESILDGVTSLLNQSLLQRDPQASHQEQRFIMLETLREYALERLQYSGEEVVIRRRHAEHYLQIAQTLEHTVMRGKSPHWIAWIESELGNLRAAFGWFLAAHDAERALEMSGKLWPFWLQSATTEGRHWIEQALEYSQQNTIQVQPTTRALALQVAALIDYYRKNWMQADILAREALELFQMAGDRCGTARTLLTQGTGALLRGCYPAAQTLAQESLSIWQKAPYSWPSVEALLLLAYGYYFQGEYSQAVAAGKQAFCLSQQTGELYTLIRTIHAYALFAEAEGNINDVQAMHGEMRTITRATIETGALSPIAVCLIGLGATAALQKHYAWAVNLWGKARLLYRRRDGLSELEPQKWLSIILNTHLLSSQAMEATYTHFGERDFTSAWNEGQAMGLEQLLVEPQSQTSLPTRSSLKRSSITYSHELTPREQEVLCLLAQGKSSASIAEELVISLVTVNSHIRAIYSKLGVSSRSAATRFALEHHLV